MLRMMGIRMRKKTEYLFIAPHALPRSMFSSSLFLTLGDGASVGGALFLKKLFTFEKSMASSLVGLWSVVLGTCWTSFLKKFFTFEKSILISSSSTCIPLGRRIKSRFIKVVK